jgi:hypothetical protein
MSSETRFLNEWLNAYVGAKGLPRSKGRLEALRQSSRRAAMAGEGQDLAIAPVNSQPRVGRDFAAPSKVVRRPKRDTGARLVLITVACTLISVLFIALCIKEVKAVSNAVKAVKVSLSVTKQ